MQLEQQLEHAHCTFPFNHLGPKFNTETSVFSICAWLPGALKVKVVDHATGKVIGDLVHTKGSHLFSADFKLAQPPKVYHFAISNKTSTYDLVDPYQFKEQAYAAVHFVDHAAHNVYKQLGAQLVSLDVGLKNPISATRFAVFAPNASAVSLIGDFNYWDGR